MRSVPDTGDREWLRELYEAHRDLIFRYARSRVGIDAAFDVVAETFIEALRSRASFDATRGSEASWLLGIATNRIRRWLRSEGRHAYQTEAMPDSQGSEDPELLALPGRLDASLAAVEVHHALAALPEGERLAITLNVVEGLDLGEVADALQISRSAAKVRVFRARRRLKKSLAHLGDEKEQS